MKRYFEELLTNPDAVQVGDEISFDGISDMLGRIRAVGKAGAVLALRNLIIDENLRVAENGANPAPTSNIPHD